MFLDCFWWKRSSFKHRQHMQCLGILVQTKLGVLRNQFKSFISVNSVCVATTSIIPTFARRMVQGLWKWQGWGLYGVYQRVEWKTGVLAIQKGDPVQSKTYQKHGKDHFAAFDALGSDYRGVILIAKSECLGLMMTMMMMKVTMCTMQILKMTSED